MSVSNDKALPDADLKSNKEADEKAIKDEANIDRHGGWGTFIVLAFVFVFLQLLGVIFGYRWGFAGRNSAEAFRAIGKGRYATYADVREHYREIADVAQSKLEALQQRIMDRNSVGGTTGQHLTKTFLDFMREAREEDAKDRENEQKYSAAKAERSRITASSVSTASSAPSAIPMGTLTAQDVIEKLNALNDKEAKKALMATLPEALDNEVRTALKTQKEELERKKQERDAELEDLL